MIWTLSRATSTARRGDAPSATAATAKAKTPANGLNAHSENPTNGYDRIILKGYEGKATVY